jgi:hypothetical protein
VGLKKTTVMVDEEDLRAVKAAAKAEGRPESEYFREAFHLVALRSRRWEGDWDIPAFDLGGPITDEDVKRAVAEGVVGKEAETDRERRKGSPAA